MTRFRPCIDIHNNQVKQIVGSTLKAGESQQELKTNFVSPHPPSYFAQLYKSHQLHGAHVIQLGQNNEQAALEALSAWPQGLQLGGGVNIDNAQYWIDQGADKVIVTSWLFPDAQFSLDRLIALSKKISKNRLVIDLSCKRHDGKWIVAMNKWQTLTDMSLSKETLDTLSDYCSEFLIHAADVEGLCQGIDEELVAKLGEWTTIPCTYAGGGKELSDLDLVKRLSNGKVDLTFGSALDIFGGSGVHFLDAVKWNQSQN